VLAFDVDLPGARYNTDAIKTAFFQQLMERLQALPGARAVGGISSLPLSGGENMGDFVIEGESPAGPGPKPNAERRWVTPGYFAAMGITIQQGRVFTAQDAVGQSSVVAINETLAKQFFQTRAALGSLIQVNGAWRTVVGVVSDVKSASLEGAPRFQVYLPHAQESWRPLTVVLHTEGNPLALAGAVRGELKQLDALLPPAKMRTMEQVMSNATSARRFNLLLLTFFAGAALLLTMIGIYGVVAFLAGQRSREIGIRMALGAQRCNVLQLILQQGMKPVGAGCGIGLLGSLAASRLIASQLYGISAWDPVTLASIVMILIIAALLACWLPARRATQVDPMVALRQD
jgi:predicted permease